MGSHFHDWVYYYAVAFLQKLQESGRTFSGFWGSENPGMQGFKNRNIRTTISLTNQDDQVERLYKKVEA